FRLMDNEVRVVDCRDLPGAHDEIEVLPCSLTNNDCRQTEHWERALGVECVSAAFIEEHETAVGRIRNGIFRALSVVDTAFRGELQVAANTVRAFDELLKDRFHI